MLFNTDLSLWQTAREHYATFPCGGARLQVHAGHIANGYEILARFKSNKAAHSLLRRAGFKRQSDGTYKAD